MRYKGCFDCRMVRGTYEAMTFLLGVVAAGIIFMYILDSQLIKYPAKCRVVSDLQGDLVVLVCNKQEAK